MKNESMEHGEVGRERGSVYAHRQESMLEELRAELRVRRMRRAAVRGVGVVVLAVAMGSVAWRAQRSSGGGASVPIVGGERAEAMAGSETLGASTKTTGTGSGRMISIEEVRTDPGVVERLAVKQHGIATEMIDDAELLRWMIEAGRPVGLIRANGRLTVVERGASGASIGG